MGVYQGAVILLSNVLRIGGLSYVLAKSFAQPCLHAKTTAGDRVNVGFSPYRRATQGARPDYELWYVNWYITRELYRGQS
jgi:hypothetical protein